MAETNIIHTFAGPQEGPGYINAGAYILDKNILKEFNLPHVFSFEIDFLSKYLRKLKPLGYVSDGFFIDIGIPDDFNNAQQSIPKFIQNLEHDKMA